MHPTTTETEPLVIRFGEFNRITGTADPTPEMVADCANMLVGRMVSRWEWEQKLRGITFRPVFGPDPFIQIRRIDGETTEVHMNLLLTPA